MKKLLLAGILLGAGSGATYAQSIGDLTAQLLLDTEKLTYMKTFLQELYQGYEIIDKGYTAITNISRDNFNLHKAFLDGLLAVSPAVQQSPRVLDILNTEYRLAAEYKTAAGRYAAGGSFTASELDYITHIQSTLLSRSLQSIEELTMILTADELRMSDAQRLQAIDRVYEEVTGQLTTLQQFDNSLSIQAAQRAKEAGTINILKSLYGLPD